MPKSGVEDNKSNWRKDQLQSDRDELLTKPGAECLSGQSISVLTGIMFVDVEREGKQHDDEEVGDYIKQDLQ